MLLELDGKIYVSANSSYADNRILVLNHYDTFGVFNYWGDIQPIGKEAQGLYFKDTRYLSLYEFKINGERPVLLGSGIIREESIMFSELTNPTFEDKQGKLLLQQGDVFLKRRKFVLNGNCFEQIHVMNFSNHVADIELSLEVSADFRDIFEIRGIPRKIRANHPEITQGKNCLRIQYEGMDQVQRNLKVSVDPAPDEISRMTAFYRLSLKPKEEKIISVNIQMEEGESGNGAELDYQKALNILRKNQQEKWLAFPEFKTSNDTFNKWLSDSCMDMISLISPTKHGIYPFAGVPWYNTVFGRDGILTAYQLLWIYPDLAKGVLEYLAATQASESEPSRDAEPGKILHETRSGELARLGEIPFGQYYGTIDATPLFIMLAGAWYERTGETDLIREIWPNIERALEWIEKSGDLDGDGFVEYQHKAKNGLTNQGWKDSYDSVFYEDGIFADPPIALCEVQGYVYAAYRAISVMACALGKKELCDRYEEKAAILKRKFNEVFWDEELHAFVLALDGEKKPCRVKSSNAGQCLFTGIVKDSFAQELAQTLLKPEMFTGWGIRTLSSDSPRYNPMSYHNGSIWPHDCALIAAGFARYGFKTEALNIFKGLYESAKFLGAKSLPELFCGFDRMPGEGPVSYPVACEPQAWSVASIYMMLQACLGITIDGVNKEICFKQPVLPQFISHMIIENLNLNGEMLCLELNRSKNDVGVNIIHKPDDWKFTIEK